MQRIELLKEMNDVMETYCEGCFLKSHFRQTYGKNYAHRFCIQNCTVGEELQKIGQVLISKQ
ncbi:zinc-finger domain-containing protein [Bacillus sp. SD088]|uniref:zinc-finger domain-containing protein n=1 Tax=Bacillus sp. SD088 TaxID=2782012 RepID=UPI001A963A85|nr:zinc-finger domain-containing protein [Bacillus sp. SD088]MBO0994809.1 zinc-finger domain-containing protein [Bacillus sp. SD088]